MSRDLAIRAVVENADLLIFPSLLLPIQSRSESHLYFIELFSVAHSDFIVCKTKLCNDSIEFLVLQDFKKSTTCGGSSEQKKTSHNTNDAVCGEVTNGHKPITLQKQSQPRTSASSCSVIQCLYRSIY